MKKKVLNATVGGYYVISIMLGVVVAIMVGLSMHSVCKDIYNYAAPIRYASTSDLANPQPSGLDLLSGIKATKASEVIGEIWMSLPMTRLYNVLYDWGAEYDYSQFAIVILAILTVGLSFMLMEGTCKKAWRQKMIQAFGIAGLILVTSWAFRTAWLCGFDYEPFRIGGLRILRLLVPLILLIVPVWTLKKVRQPKRDAVCSEE